MINPLPDDWAHDVDDDALEFLLEESRAQTAEQSRSASAQERTAVALTVWAVIAIGASGLFGDLRFGFEEAPIVAVLSVLALATFAGVFAVAIRQLWPSTWGTDSDVEWLATYACDGATRRELMIETIAALVDGFRRNQQSLERRDRMMPWLAVLVAVEVGFVIAIQLAALASS